MPKSNISNSAPLSNLPNPLLIKIAPVQGRIAQLKERVKIFYFQVLLSDFKCPHCDGSLTMTGRSECSCSCGNVLDPTLSFQKSTCCRSRLIRKTCHYACSICMKNIPSRFLFDERVFDKAYFKELMKESRARSRRRREEMKRFLADARSETFPILEVPCLESIPGLIEDLDGFIGSEEGAVESFDFEMKKNFSMQNYRNHILASLGIGCRFFSRIDHLASESRQDRAWRFITLVFMWNDREVELKQYDNDLLIERLEGEAYYKG